MSVSEAKTEVIAVGCGDGTDFESGSVVEIWLWLRSLAPFLFLELPGLA